MRNLPILQTNTPLENGSEELLSLEKIEKKSLNTKTGDFMKRIKNSIEVGNKDQLEKIKKEIQDSRKEDKKELKQWFENWKNNFSKTESVSAEDLISTKE